MEQQQFIGVKMLKFDKMNDNYGRGIQEKDHHFHMTKGALKIQRI